MSVHDDLNRAIRTQVAEEQEAAFGGTEPSGRVQGYIGPNDLAQAFSEGSGGLTNHLATLESIYNRLEKLPSKAAREGDKAPSVWIAIGQCMADLRRVIDEVRS